MYSEKVAIFLECIPEKLYFYCQMLEAKLMPFGKKS